jgi:hypothetical protein
MHFSITNIKPCDPNIEKMSFLSQNYYTRAEVIGKEYE